MAGTQITPGLDQINNAFGSIYSMFGNPSSGSSLTGGGSGMFGMSPQPISGADNSLTAAQRTASNALGQMAPSAFSMGTGLLGTGTGVAQGGLDVMGTGLNTLQPSIDFYSKLLSGDPTATTQALAPTAANIAAITAGAANRASEGMPGGGYRASTLAGLPFAQASQVGSAALQLQPAAAAALGQLGGEQAQIGAGMAGVGTTLGGLGTTLTGQGVSGLASLVAIGLDNAHVFAFHARTDGCPDDAQKHNPVGPTTRENMSLRLWRKLRRFATTNSKNVSNNLSLQIGKNPAPTSATSIT